MVAQYMNKKEMMKKVIRDEFDNFMNMFDCVDEPPELSYSVNVHGVNIRIDVSNDNYEHKAGK